MREKVQQDKDIFHNVLQHYEKQLQQLYPYCQFDLTIILCGTVNQYIQNKSKKADKKKREKKVTEQRWLT